jgi:enoyl-CoA hydratase/carnithine racemase
MPRLSQHDGVWLLDLGDGENRFSPSWIETALALLDDAATGAPERPLVTVATGKFWSNGLDVDWIGQHPERLAEYLTTVERLLGRVLRYPAPTAAAVQGHAFGAGAMLALAHDWRFMRADRGYLCLPEVDLGLPFTPGMLALLQAKLTPAQATELMITGRRLGGDQAQMLGVVTQAVDEPSLRSAPIGCLVAHGAKPAGAVGRIKQDLYAPALALLEQAGAA